MSGGGERRRGAGLAALGAAERRVSRPQVTARGRKSRRRRRTTTTKTRRRTAWTRRGPSSPPRSGRGCSRREGSAWAPRYAAPSAVRGSRRGNKAVTAESGVGHCRTAAPRRAATQREPCRAHIVPSNKHV